MKALEDDKVSRKAEVLVDGISHIHIENVYISINH